MIVQITVRTVKTCVWIPFRSSTSKIKFKTIWLFPELNPALSNYNIHRTKLCVQLRTVQRTSLPLLRTQLL